MTLDRMSGVVLAQNRTFMTTLDNVTPSFTWRTGISTFTHGYLNLPTQELTRLDSTELYLTITHTTSTHLRRLKSLYVSLRSMAPQPSNIWEKIVATKAQKPRRNLLLLYLWKLIPGTTDAIHAPDDSTKIMLYNHFISDCNDLQNTSVIASFNSAFKSHNYPWTSGNTLAASSGQVWATVFAQVTIKLGIQVRNARSKTPEEMSKEVASMVEQKVYAEWFPVLDRIFVDA
jgi:hypothetical protein